MSPQPEDKESVEAVADESCDDGHQVTDAIGGTKAAAAVNNDQAGDGDGDNAAASSASAIGTHGEADDDNGELATPAGKPQDQEPRPSGSTEPPKEGEVPELIDAGDSTPDIIDTPVDAPVDAPTDANTEVEVKAEVKPVPSKEQVKTAAKQAAKLVAKPAGEEQTTDNDNDNGTSNNDEACPICLTVGENMVQTPCHHTFCHTCIEQVLEAHGEATVRFPPSAPMPSGSSNQAVKNTDSHLMAPTLGRCPLCRAELSLFQLRGSASDELSYPKNHDWQSHLAGSTFVPYGRHVTGNKSFHFPGDQQPDALPYMDVSQCIVSRPNDWKLADGESVPPHLDIHDGHYHAMSRTFHGTIKFPNDNRFRGSYEWHIVLGISQNGKFLSSGVVVERDERVLHSTDITQNDTGTSAASASALAPTISPHIGMTQHDLRECLYPLEGDWKLVWISDDIEKSLTITVQYSAYQQSKWSFVIHYSIDASGKEPAATIYWPKSKTRQTTVSGLDLIKQPKGPDVGQRIEWETTNEHFQKISWIRLTRARPPPEPRRSTVLGTGQEQILYQLLMRPGTETSDAINAQGGQTGSSIAQEVLPAIPTYHADDLWGNVFIKKLRIGQASYHFVSPEASYLSYEHTDCRNLPNLDDGTPLPTRLPFRNVEWDRSSLRFKATIEWERDAGTSWNDNVRWTLGMTFDSEFMIIRRGGIQCEWCAERRAPIRPPRRPPPNRPKPVAIYVPPTPPKEGQPPPPQQDRNEEWLMSGYGYDQLYINAACLERYRANSPPMEDSRGTFDYYAQTFLKHRKRLKAEEATARSIEYLEKVFKAAAENPGSNAIDYNIA